MKSLYKYDLSEDFMALTSYSTGPIVNIVSG